VKVELTRTADYAIRAALVIADAEAGGLTTAEIISQADIPATYAPQVLSRLVRGGVVTSKPGPNGGYHLRDTAGGVSLLEVIEAAEGPMTATRCVLRGSRCSAARPCRIHFVMADARGSMRSVLADISLDQLRREV